MIRQHVVDEVKKYLDYCATPAHERRREDVSRYGGKGKIKNFQIVCNLTFSYNFTYKKVLFVWHFLQSFSHFISFHLGSGATWSNSISKFISENFFDGRKPPSKQTVRRLGLAPNRKAGSSKYYRGTIIFFCFF